MMKKLYIDRTKSLYIVHTIDYSIAIWCDDYTIRKTIKDKKYISMRFGMNYLGTIDCDEVEVEF